MIKNKVDIKSIVLYDHTFLFTAYAYDSTFSLKGISSVKMLVESFKEFTSFSGLKPNIAKREIAGSGPVTGVLEAVCSLKTVDLTNDAINPQTTGGLFDPHYVFSRNVSSKERVKPCAVFLLLTLS